MVSCTTAQASACCISLLKQYQDYLDSKAFANGGTAPKVEMQRRIGLCSVGVIGGGMAGLYSAMLLQKYLPDANVKVLEANDRVGGRVYTYRPPGRGQPLYSGQNGHGPQSVLYSEVPL